MRKLATTKMSSKGQVVIPEEIREQLHLHSGDQFIVMADKGTVILKIIEAPSLQDLKPLIAKARKVAKESDLTKEEVTTAIKAARKK